MNKKRKKLLIISLLLAGSLIAVAVGMRYFPFSKVMKMPAVTEEQMEKRAKQAPRPPNTFSYDFELPAGSEVPGNFYKGIAHSGQFSGKAFGKNTFSLAIEKTAGEIGIENLGAVGLSAWVYVFPTDNEVKGSFVFSASNDLGVNISWHGVNVNDPYVPRGQWFKVSGSFNLNDVGFKPGNKIQVYFWNTSSTDILVDDYFVSFGKARERVGDSALVDLTRPEGYIPRFNYPPFRVGYFERDTTGMTIRPQEIGRDDLVLSGKFFTSAGDALLTLSKAGKFTAFIPCREKNSFVKVAVNKSSRITMQPNLVLKGNFLGKSTEQLILSDGKQFVLCSISDAADPCNLPPSTSNPPLTLTPLTTPEPFQGTLCASDFTGSGRATLMVVAPVGNWKMLTFEPSAGNPGKWNLFASSGDQVIEPWNSNENETTLTPGKFLPGTRSDQLLTVSRPSRSSRSSRSSRPSRFTLHTFNPSQKTWQNFYAQSGSGKVIGLDTLKPEDQYLLFDGVNGRPSRIFRYNRDWRFDLKEISFNDSSYTIVSNFDFVGYEKDFNPKYYETLQLVPGQFAGSSSNSLIVIGRNAAGRGYEAILPDFIHIYSLPLQK